MPFVRGCWRLVVIADLIIQVSINRWSRLFIDALERRDTATVVYGVQLILALAVAAAASLRLRSAAGWLAGCL